MSIKAQFENRSSFDFSLSSSLKSPMAELTEGLHGHWSDENRFDDGSPATLDFPDALAGKGADSVRPSGLTDFSNPSALEAIDRFIGEERGASPSKAALGNSPVWADTPALELIEHYDSCGCSGCCGFREEPVEASGTGEAVAGESSGAAGILGDMADFLLTGYWNTGYGDGTRSHNVTNSGTDANNGVLHYNLSGFSGDVDGLTANRAELVRESFKLFGSTLGIEFAETTSTDTNFVDFFFKDNDSGAYAGSSYYNSGAWGSTLHYSTINIAQSWSGGTSTYDDYTLQTILHEIGHALGLGHQGSYNGSASYGVDNTFDNDNWQSSMMSYFSQTQNTAVTASYEFLQTPMAVDWLALDEIYGRQGYGVSNAYTEDTTWGFNTTVTSDVSDIWASWSNWANRTASTIVDGGGIDTLDLSGYSNNTLINLAPSDPGSTQPSTSDIGGRIGNLTIAAGTVIENVVGGAGSETFYGNAADNVMIGNGGDDIFFDSDGSDTFEGGAGVDDLIFTGAFADFTYSIVGDFLQVTDTVVDWVQDTVEWLVFAGDDRRSWQSVADLSTGGNTAPVANDDVGSVDEDNTVVISLLENDTDADSDALNIVSVGAAANGDVVDNGDGTVTYTPDANFSGSDSFSYTVSDGKGGTSSASVIVTVNAVNDNPVANADSATTETGASVTVNVLANDTDLDLDTLSVASVGVASNGQVVSNGDGTITYTPDADFFGVDSFSYTVTDGNGGSDTATVTIDVLEVNTPPVANDDVASVDEDSSVVIAVLSNDTDGNSDTLFVTGIGAAANGDVVDNGDGTVTYTPDTDFNGTDSFAYTVSDGRGGSDTATVTISVNPVNDGPTAVDDSASTAEDSTATVAVLANDSDSDGGTLSVTEVNGVAAQVGAPVTLSSGATVTLQADGTFDYDPNGAFNSLEDGQTDTDSFTYTVSDGQGGVDIATVSIAIDGVSPPIASENVTITFESEAPGAFTGDNGLIFSGLDVVANTSISGDRVGAAGSDGGFSIVAGGEDFDLNSLSLISQSGRQKIAIQAFDDGALVGSVQVNTSARRASDVAFDASFDGVDAVVFSAGSNFYVDDISLTTNMPIDPNTNFAPITANDALTTGEASAVTGNVLTNDSDPNGDPLTVATVEGQAVQAGGTGVTLASGATVTLNPNGDVNYDPNGAFNALYDGQEANDSFTYEVSDGRGGVTEGTVNVAIQGAGTPPASTTIDFEAAVQDGTTVAADAFTFADATISTENQGVVSGSQAIASIGSSISISMSNGEAFDFEAGIFTIEGKGRKDLIVDAYFEDGLVGSETFTIRTGRETSINLADAVFDQVDEVVVSSAGGVLMDDLTFLV